MPFVWDPSKAASNLRKHSVTFEEAATVFDDAIPEVRDWSKARRNPYVRGGRARVLDADLAKAFPDSTSMNAALRELLAVRAVLRPRRTRA